MTQLPYAPLPTMELPPHSRRPQLRINGVSTETARIKASLRP